MSSYTKYMYQKKVQQNKKDFGQYIDTIIPILPAEYTSQTIIYYLKQYYPFEYRMLKEQCKYYAKQARTLKKFGKKKRYFVVNADDFLEHMIRAKGLLKFKTLDNHKKHFSSFEQEKAEDALRKVRIPKINKVQIKISEAQKHVQAVDPAFLEKLRGFYSRKNASQKDKVYILQELQKYYSNKMVQFFKRIAQSEYNFQLREMAFHYLQNFKHFTELRKQKYMRIHTKNKKRRAMIRRNGKVRYEIPQTPQELEYRIHNQGKEQKYKSYDYFISHSYKDYTSVQHLINLLNDAKKNIYCDWISDEDYLKRELFCEDTTSVLRRRIEQSNAVIFVSSSNSQNSYWVQRELKYARKCGKEIFKIDKETINQDKVSLKKYIE